MRTSKAQVVALAAALLAADASAPLLAQPVIRVEAEARLELASRRTETGTELRLSLIDDQGAPISGAPISYRIASSSGSPLTDRRRALTGSDGAVVVELAPLDEQISVEVRFDGDDFRSAASRVELLDTRLQRTELRFAAPAQSVIDLREPELLVRVRARGDGAASDLRIAISDERGVELGTATTDAQGVAELAVSTATLGGPGAGKLTARARGDVQRAPASAELTIVRWLPSTTTLELARTGRALAKGHVLAKGRVLAGGRGIADAAVGLFTREGAHVATVQSDHAGQFEAVLELSALGAQGRRADVELEARFDSDAPWLGSSRSARASLQLKTTGPSPLWLALAPLAIALSLWWLGRRKRAVEESSAPAKIAEAGVALAQAKPRAGRPRGIACTVLDARTGRPVREAALELVDPSGARIMLRGDARGHVRVDELAAGQHALTFRAQGYRALHVSLDSPHRGEWLGAHVRLESLRDVALRAWAPLSAQQAAKPEQAAALTLREALERVLSGRDASPKATHEAKVHEALERTERAAYDRAQPTEDDVERIERDASALVKAHEARERSPRSAR